MIQREILDSIPIDLILEILSRLSAKSIGRCRCVSKLWRSMLGRPYFTELFLTRSSHNSRLLFGVKEKGEWLFFSSPQPQNLYQKSSLVVAADFHMKLSQDISPYYKCSYAFGLIYFPSMQIKKESMDAVGVICNPITGQYAILPKLIAYIERKPFLGFDPIDKQFKVLLVATTYDNKCVQHILTLGTDKMRWRKIQCPLNHKPFWDEICINGVLYYLATPADGTSKLIGCFDVRSEKIKFIDIKCFCEPPYVQLINYNGKLSGINFVFYDVGGRHTVDLKMWVLDDAEKLEWSKYISTLPENVVQDSNYFSVAGVTSKGDIVFYKSVKYKPFYVFYLNPYKNIIQRVEIHGNHEVFDNQYPVYAFLDHVEVLKFDIMKKTYAATSISPSEPRHKPTSTTTSSRKDHQVRTVAHPQQDLRTFESINKFDVLRFLDDDELT